MSAITSKTISEMVRKDYRLADVFKKWGINYCCGGNGTLDEVCNALQLDKALVEKEIEQATQTIQLPNTLQFEIWPFDFMVDYIFHVHHSYIKIFGPRLQQILFNYVEGHKTKYPHLVDVQKTFHALLNALLEHTKKEDEVIFPYIKQINSSYKQKATYGPLLVRTLKKSLADVTGKEHTQIAELLTALREAANNYVFPEDACTNHQVIYHKLKEFDADLVQHKHLENNILFPKATQMEKELLQL